MQKWEEMLVTVEEDDFNETLNQPLPQIRFMTFIEYFQIWKKSKKSLKKRQQRQSRK